MTEQDKVSEKAVRQAKRATDMLSAPRVTKRHISILNGLAYLMFLMGISLFSYLGYSLFWPVKPIVIKSAMVSNSPVSSKGSLIYTVDLCKNVNTTPTTYRKLVSSNNYGVPFPATQGVATKGCGVYHVTVKMPPDTPPGKYRLYTDVEYKINALRTVHIFWHTPEFEVVP